MDKILETLSQKFSAEELNEVKKAIEFTVDEKVKAKSEQEARVIAKKADEYCQKKIKEAVEKKTTEIEEIANKFCEERCDKLSKEADAKVESYKKKLEETSEQYILEFFDEKFTEKYGQELEAIEEKVITGLDKYLEYNINDNVVIRHREFSGTSYIDIVCIAVAPFHTLNNESGIRSRENMYGLTFFRQ